MKRRAILVGAGGMGRAWARNLLKHPSVEIAAWVDTRLDTARKAAEEEGVSALLTDDLGRAIAEAEGHFVVDVTPPEAHCATTIQALEAGLPVLGEKPMAASMDEARRMVAASRRAGKLYMVSQSRRYHGQLQAYKRLIADSAGAPEILNSDFYIGAHFGGFRDEMDSPLLLDMAIHTFDAARFLTDRDAVAVYCEEFNPSWSWYAGKACTVALFEMGGGLRYTYRGSWCAEGCHTSWESDWRAVGPRGTAVWDGSRPPRAEHVVAPGGFHSITENVQADVEDVAFGIEGSLAEFLHALDTGSTPNGECGDNIKSLAMVFGAQESAATGRRVRIEIGV
jgi:predicted dehydrogenase